MKERPGKDQEQACVPRAGCCSKTTFAKIKGWEEAQQRPKRMRKGQRVTSPKPPAGRVAKTSEQKSEGNEAGTPAGERMCVWDIHRRLAIPSVKTRVAVNGGDTGLSNPQTSPDGQKKSDVICTQSQFSAQQSSMPNPDRGAFVDGWGSTVHGACGGVHCRKSLVDFQRSRGTNITTTPF